MNIPAKLAHRFVRNNYVTALSLLVSFVSFGIVMSDVLSDRTPKVGAILGLVAALIFFVVTHLYSLRVRADNQNLQEIAKYFREINTIYRETLFSCFWERVQALSLDERLSAEKSTLKSVCQSIARIFTRLLYGKECMVTVKLLTDEDDGISYATTYIRNQESSERDIGDRRKYEVNTGRNSGLDQALKNKPPGELSYFILQTSGKKKTTQISEMIILIGTRALLLCLFAARCGKKGQARLTDS